MRTALHFAVVFLAALAAVLYGEGHDRLPRGSAERRRAKWLIGIWLFVFAVNLFAWPT